MTRQQLADDLRVQISDEPIQFVFSDSIYIGAFSGELRTQPLEIGGYDDTPTATLVVPLLTAEGNETFQELPQVHQTLSIGPRSYRITRTETDAMRSCLQMDLGSIYK